VEAAGHVRATSEDAADLVIVNTCSVRGKAEDKALGKLGLLCATKRDRPNRIVGVMGCMAQRLGDGLFAKVPASTSRSARAAAARSRASLRACRPARPISEKSPAPTKRPTCPTPTPNRALPPS
jgi:tRNA A37 methylthiotransferase MiaB